MKLSVIKTLIRAIVLLAIGIVISFVCRFAGFSFWETVAVTTMVLISVQTIFPKLQLYSNGKIH